VKIRVEVLWVVTTCIVVVGYQRFRGPCCLHLVKIQVGFFWVVTPYIVVVGNLELKGNQDIRERMWKIFTMPNMSRVFFFFLCQCSILSMRLVVYQDYK